MHSPIALSEDFWCEGWVVADCLFEAKPGESALASSHPEYFIKIYRFEENHQDRGKVAEILVHHPDLDDFSAADLEARLLAKLREASLSPAMSRSLSFRRCCSVSPARQASVSGEARKRASASGSA